MFTKLAKMQRKEEGFTLIELLIVVAIIAILAAIAIPQFSAYRQRGYNTASTSDLRTLRTSEEAMMADFNDYGASRTSSADIPPQHTGVESTTDTVYLVAGNTSSIPSLTIKLSPSVSVIANVDAGAPTTGKNTLHNMAAVHSAGSNYYGVVSNGAGVYRKGFVAPVAALSTVTTSVATGASTDLVGGNWISVQ